MVSAIQISLITTTQAELDDALDVKQANGWLRVKGESDLTFSVGGVGKVDLARSGHGNPAYTKTSDVKRKGHSIEAGPSGGTIVFEPYWNLDYMLAAFNDTASSSSSNSGPYFDGQLSARVKSDFGDYRVNFPPNPEDEDGSRNIDRRDNRISIRDEHNIIYNAAGAGGRLALSSLFTFGLKVKFELWGDLFQRTFDLTDVSLHLADILGQAQET